MQGRLRARRTAVCDEGELSTQKKKREREHGWKEYKVILLLALSKARIMENINTRFENNR